MNVVTYVLLALAVPSAVEIGIGMLDLATTVVDDGEPETALEPAFSSTATGPVLVAARQPSNIQPPSSTHQHSSIRRAESAPANVGGSHAENYPITPAIIKVNIAFSIGYTGY